MAFELPKLAYAYDALEPHIENPESSAIFAEYPPMLQDHALMGLICDTIRLMVVSSGNLSPYAVEDVMTASIKNHHHHEMANAGFWSNKYLPSEALANFLK